MTNEEEIRKEFDEKFGIYWSKNMEGNVIYGGNNHLPQNKWAIINQEVIKDFLIAKLKAQDKIAREEERKEIIYIIEDSRGFPVDVITPEEASYLINQIKTKDDDSLSV